MKAEHVAALTSLMSQNSASGSGSSSFRSLRGLDEEDEEEDEDKDRGMSEREGTVDSTADLHPGVSTTLAELSRIKRERLSHTQTGQITSSSSKLAASSNANMHSQMISAYASAPITPMATPRYCMERSASPSPSAHHLDSFGGDGYSHSFESGGMGGREVLQPLFGETGYALGSMGMDLGMGMGIGMPMLGSGVSPFDDAIWASGMNGSGERGEEEDEVEGEGSVAVKVEPRWEEQYRR